MLNTDNLLKGAYIITIKLSTISVYLCFLFATNKIHSEEPVFATSFEKSLKSLEASYPKDDEVDITARPLFYLYSSQLDLNERTIERQRSFFEKGLSEADISNSCWRQDEWASYTKPNVEEYITIRGFPVTKAEFMKTYNFRCKRLLNVQIETLDLNEMDFEDWILREVRFDRCRVSKCNFNNSILVQCEFTGFEGKRARVFARDSSLDKSYLPPDDVIINPDQLSFKQFSSTWNYKNNIFCDVKLLLMDLSDWDFAQKDLSSLELIFCVCAKENGSESNFERTEFSNSQYYAQFEKRYSALPQPSRLIGFPFLATSKMLEQTRNYNDRNCQHMAISIPNANLTSQNIDFGEIIISPNVILSNALIRHSCVTSSGYDFSNPNGIDAFNNKLYSTKSYKIGDLRGVGFRVDLIECDLTNQNLSGSVFYKSVRDARFDGAIITGCDFLYAKDLTLEQIKSTWNYKNGRMEDVLLPEELRYEIHKDEFYNTKSFQEKKLRQEEFGVSAFRRAPEVELPKCYSRSGKTYASMYDNWGDYLLDLERIANAIGKKYYLPYPRLDGWDLSGMDLSDAIVSAMSMKDADFTDANIDGICFQERYKFNGMNPSSSEPFGLFLPKPIDEEIIKEPGLFGKGQLVSTASYKNRRLANATFSEMCDLRGVDLSGFDLSNTLFITSLAEVDLTDAVITNCVFGGYTNLVHKGKYVRGADYVDPQLTAEQIKSTWNYKHNKMKGISLPESLRKELGLPKEGDEDSSSRDLDSNE